MERLKSSRNSMIFSLGLVAVVLFSCPFTVKEGAQVQERGNGSIQGQAGSNWQWLDWALSQPELPNSSLNALKNSSLTPSSGEFVPNQPSNSPSGQVSNQPSVPGSNPSTSPSLTPPSGSSSGQSPTPSSGSSSNAPNPPDAAVNENQQDYWPLITKANVQDKCLAMAKKEAASRGLSDALVFGCACDADESPDYKGYECKISALDGMHSLWMGCTKIMERCSIISEKGTGTYTFEELEQMTG